MFKYMEYDDEKGLGSISGGIFIAFNTKHSLTELPTWPQTFVSLIWPFFTIKNYNNTNHDDDMQAVRPNPIHLTFRS